MFNQNPERLEEHQLLEVSKKLTNLDVFIFYTETLDIVNICFKYLQDKDNLLSDKKKG